MFGKRVDKESGYVACVVFYFIDFRNLLPFVYHKNNRRRHCHDQQESAKADSILGKRSTGFKITESAE